MLWLLVLLLPLVVIKGVKPWIFADIALMGAGLGFSMLAMLLGRRLAEGLRGLGFTLDLPETNILLVPVPDPGPRPSRLRFRCEPGAGAKL